MGSLAVWLLAGVLFGFSEGWAYAVTVYLSVLTFLLICLQRRTHHKQTMAMQAKLNELIDKKPNADNGCTDNHLINLEKEREREVARAHG